MTEELLQVVFLETATVLELGCYFVGTLCGVTGQVVYLFFLL